jgi:hypothetical protein
MCLPLFACFLVLVLCRSAKSVSAVEEPCWYSMVPAWAGLSEENPARRGQGWRGVGGLANKARVQYISESLRRRARRRFFPFFPPLTHSSSTSSDQHISSQLYNNYFYITAPRKPTNVSRDFSSLPFPLHAQLNSRSPPEHCTAHSPTPSSQTLKAETLTKFTGRAAVDDGPRPEGGRASCRVRIPVSRVTDLQRVDLSRPALAG